MDRKKETLLSPLLDRTLEALKGQRSVRTLENYRSSINKVKEFAGDGWESLTMENITKCWTDKYAAWLEKRHADKPQTADFYLRTFRARMGSLSADIVPADTFLLNVRSEKRRCNVCSRPT